MYPNTKFFIPLNEYSNILPAHPSKLGHPVLTSQWWNCSSPNSDPALSTQLDSRDGTTAYEKARQRRANEPQRSKHEETKKIFNIAFSILYRKREAIEKVKDTPRGPPRTIHMRIVSS